MGHKKIKIVAISGSLRANSSTNAVVKVIAGMVPENVDFIIYNGLGDLPHFNDSSEVPAPVEQFRKLLRDADGILICTPEYAFGLPGVLKNALDWTVSSGEFVFKPVAVITAATGGENAHKSLLLTLTALTADIPEGGAVLIPFIRSKFDKEGNLSDPATIQLLDSVLNVLVNKIIQTNAISLS
ncbi:MAG TPA: NAD(P)H-dependent oxidoreductase [Flavipsychrobacter sp.]|nr:NAD(P)H-dependent oxidoreductase [Flavipsychrobacter sp.]